MSNLTQKSQNKPALSLKNIQILMIVMASLFSAVLLIFTFSASRTSRALSVATDQYIQLHDAVDELMNASDYLTEMAQRYTDRGDPKYLNAYFEEAYYSKRRQEALEIMARFPDAASAKESLEQAYDASLTLMDREYYSMRLVIEAKGCRRYPEILRRVQLSEADAALSPEEKMDLAQSMLLDEDYYSQKDRIRTSMHASRDMLAENTQQTQLDSETRLIKDLELVRIIIIAQCVMLMLMIWITIRLGIHPVIAAVKSIQSDTRIPEMGASEFRYLAQAYNKMYEYYHSSIQKLNYKASHDQLTQLYNRSGYDLLLSGLDLGSTFFLLIDVDCFKDVNDSYGHEVGDRVLQKVASTIRRQFRSDDYVCRIGGDEFAVLMTHVEPAHKHLLSGKLMRINVALTHPRDGLPAVSLSAGISHGRYARNAEELFEQADQALYETKRKGRNGYTFHRSLEQFLS